MVPNWDDHPKTDRCMRKRWHWSDRSQESGVILRDVSVFASAGMGLIW